jgi:hypothetical protein
VRFLTLAHNRIQNVDGLKNLSHLCFLDLSHNKIASVNKGKNGEWLHCIPFALILVLWAVRYFPARFSSHVCFIVSRIRAAVFVLMMCVIEDGEVLLNSVVELTYNVLVHAGNYRCWLIVFIVILVLSFLLIYLSIYLFARLFAYLV